MNINDFDKYAKAGKCPICGGNNLSGHKNGNGMTIYECLNCGGVPSYCRGEVYLSRTGSSDHYTNGDCSHCGERRTSANDHAYLCKW